MQPETEIKFSIIIPLYNSENYIRETLQSLCAQTYKKFEVVLVNDHSTDNSKRVTEDFLNLHTELNGRLYDRPNEFSKGVSGTRNYGLKQAKGEWVCFLDSDDLFHPRKLELLNDCIEKQGQQFQIMHHTPLDFFDGDPVVFEKVETLSQYKVEDITEQLCKKNIVYTSCVCSRLDLIQENGSFDVGLNGIEDYYLWLQLSKKSKWAYINAGLTAYRVRKGSLMGGRKMKYYIDQNYKLVSKALHNNSFSVHEKNDIEQYLMGDIMHYYASISLANYGWKDFLSGLGNLIKIGYFRTAFTLFSKHVKFQVLKTISKLFRRK